MKYYPVSIFIGTLSLIVLSILLLANKQNNALHRKLQFQSELSQKPLKILYIVTSIAEYDNGKRKTILGRDRFAETLIPVVSEGVQSMLKSGYQVDVYLIAHYQVRPHRYQSLRNALPLQVGLQVWDDATPISYPKPSEGTADRVVNVTRALARQHRYVVKDKFHYYDFFVNFEDDMLIHGDHIDQYLYLSRQIDQARKAAPFRLPHTPGVPVLTVEEALNNFYGPMAKVQLGRVIPGFIRVERANNTEGLLKRTRPGGLPATDLYQNRPIRVDSKPCCDRPGESLPASEDLFLWETHIRALGIRQMPEPLDWVLLQRGGSAYKLEAEMLIGDYWSGRDEDFKGMPSEEHRPDSMDSIYANSMGGWMATRKQIFNWHARLCNGGLLPPLDAPMYPMDGMNYVVEYWSGGGNLYGRKACNLQRIVPLDPQGFSRHLLYHTSNNKQRQLKFVKGLFSQVDFLLKQLHTVRSRAEQLILQQREET